MRLAVLVSGTGSILEAMIEAGLPVTLVLSDRACRGVEVAAAAGIDAAVVERDRFGPGFDRAAYSKRLAVELDGGGVDLVAMAGFGTVLAPAFFDCFGGTVLNTHPSLLPAFPGWRAVADALAHGAKVTGCTVHIAVEAVDAGPVLAQEAVPVLPDDTEASLHERIKAAERRLYPATIAEFARTRLDRRGAAA
ncbi:MAG TPA: phosphoribosylglycinamide formyltransferase [Acidimicrobiaceae bacterium]|nr:phosphoribosylglycinamide formyltransferase [Acidimicrobiaceae bacterium]HCB37451.1 phosphoribosylglycinamide formyltransferase [Acidimicrobiaceae bacterium]